MSGSKQTELLRLVADPTRHKVLEILLNNPPQNPSELAMKLNLTRPGIEKHLKLLRDYLLVEREVEAWPSPRFVYGITQSGADFLGRLTAAVEIYVEEARSSVTYRLDTNEKRFVLGKINRPQYEEQLKESRRLQQLFED